MSCKKRELNPITNVPGINPLPKAEFTAISKAAKAALEAQVNSVGSGGANSPFANGELL
jgi:hypothetical protein